jgi:hypothetical protein
MNRSQLVLALSLALVPCAVLLAGCPDEKTPDTADSSAAAAPHPSATAALTVAAPTATPTATPSATPTMSAAADAGPSTEAGKADAAHKK